MFLALFAGVLSGCSSPTERLATNSPTLCTRSGEAQHDDTPGFRLLGEIRWEVDTSYGGVPVGGLSSIDWDAARNEFLLVSDDRSVHGPARFYAARMRYDASGLHSVWLSDMRPLLSHEQQPYANAQQASKEMAVPDAEALRVIPRSGHVLWTSEGDFSRGFGPALHEMRRDGSWVRSWPLPDNLQLPTHRQNAAKRGPRNGFTLEGMSFSPDARLVWLSMEGALWQDGPMPTASHAGAPVRMTALEAQTREPVRQIAYQPDALPASVQMLPQRAVNGVSEILADGPDHLLVLERSFSLGEGWGARLYRISLRADGPNAATDVLQMPELLPGSYRVASKTLVLDFAQLGLRSVDNIEGMTWGPALPTGERVLVLVSDNNFNPAEVTQFIALVERTACKFE